MKIVSLLHASFEDEAGIGTWAASRGHALTRCRLYAGEPLPGLADFDFLVVMGGPMNIYEVEKYPWLAPEKELLAQAVDAGKLVLGVCLGAQLLADVLDAEVTRNPEREIGWLTVEITPQGGHEPVFAGLPQRFMAFHWHGDTFDCPLGAAWLACSQACANQAFSFGRGKVVGLQFHLETTPESMERLIENCADEIGRGLYTQSPQQMREHPEYFVEINSVLTRLLDNMAGLKS